MFSKTPTIKVSTFHRGDPDIKELAKLYPIIPASKSGRGWWKNLERTYTQERQISPDKKVQDEWPTFKYCVGMYDFTNCGYMVQWIHDIEFYVNKVGEITWFLPPMIPLNWVEIHGKEQTGSCPVQHGDGGDSILKINTPFIIETPKNWSMLFCKPFYSYNNDFDICSGILDSDQKAFPCHQVKIFLRFNVRNKIIKFKAGDPMCQLIPFKRIKTKLEYLDAPSKEIQEQELYRRMMVQSQFENSNEYNDDTLLKFRDQSFWTKGYQ